MLNKLYLWSRKLHRVFLFAVVVLTLLMGVTGLFMKYTSFAKSVGVNPGLIRYLHNQMSGYFTIVLVIMMLTGIFMYVSPIFVARRVKKQNKIQD